MSSDLNFEIEKRTDGSSTSLSISGIPIASGTPTDGQVLVYNAATNQFVYQTPANSTRFLIGGFPVEAGPPTDTETIRFDAISQQWQFSV